MRARAAVASGLGLAAMAVAVGLVFDWDFASLATLLGMAALAAAGGFAWGRWRAVLWVGVLPWAAASLIADALWLSGVWDRSEAHEPLPVSMIVLPLGVPMFAVAAALGVSLRRAAARSM